MELFWSTASAGAALEDHLAGAPRFHRLKARRVCGTGSVTEGHVQLAHSQGIDDVPGVGQLDGVIELVSDDRGCLVAHYVVVDRYAHVAICSGMCDEPCDAHDACPQTLSTLHIRDDVRSVDPNHEIPERRPNCPIFDQ